VVVVEVAGRSELYSAIKMIACVPFVYYQVVKSKFKAIVLVKRSSLVYLSAVVGQRKNPLFQVWT
jgi:hypothetical protein